MVCSTLQCSVVCQLFPLTDWGGDPDGSILVMESSHRFKSDIVWANKSEGHDWGMLVLNTDTPAVGCTLKTI